MYNINIIEDYKLRLIYSFYLRDNIYDINELLNDKDYKLHFKCLELIFQLNNQYDEITFIITTNNQNTYLIKELKIKLSTIFIFCKNIKFIIEPNDPTLREGIIFKKYVFDKLNEYDGLTLFFHNKRVNPTYPNKLINEDITYWILGQYYFNMAINKEFMSNFIKSNKLIYGWPYMHDNYHPHWLIGGTCFLMKCQDIQKYLDDNKPQNNPITTKCIGEYIFLELLENDLFDYPCSNIIKDYVELDYYEPAINKLFLENYLQKVLPYNEYINFMNFCDTIINYD